MLGKGPSLPAIHGKRCTSPPVFTYNPMDVLPNNSNIEVDLNVTTNFVPKGETQVVELKPLKALD